MFIRQATHTHAYTLLMRGCVCACACVQRSLKVVHVWHLGFVAIFQSCAEFALLRMRYIAYTRRTPKANPADKQQHTRTQTGSQTYRLCVFVLVHLLICLFVGSIKPGRAEAGPVQIRQHLPHILVNKFEWEKRGEKRQKDRRRKRTIEGIKQASLASPVCVAYKKDCCRCRALCHNKWAQVHIKCEKSIKSYKSVISATMGCHRRQASVIVCFAVTLPLSLSLHDLCVCNTLVLRQRYLSLAVNEVSFAVCAANQSKPTFDMV